MHRKGRSPPAGPSEMSQLSLALVQMDLAAGDRARNIRSATALVQRARSLGADVAVLPELWTSAYDLAGAADHATALQSGAPSPAAPIAASAGLYVCGSELEIDGGAVFNSLTVHSPAGERLATYRKIHLFGLMDEPKYLAAGSVPVTVDVGGMRAGLAICYDLRFPELFRRYAVEGVDVFFVSAEWPEPRLDHWRTLLRSRAIENQCFVAACNRVGETAGTRFFGHSMVIDPWGEILAEGGNDEDVVIAKIDLARVAETRSRYPFLADRRNGVYGLP